MDRAVETMNRPTIHAVMNRLDSACSPTQFEQAKLGAELLGVPRRITDEATIYADLYRDLDSNAHPKLGIRGNGLILLFGLLEEIGVSVRELNALEKFVSLEKLRELKQVGVFGYAKMVISVCNCIGREEFSTFADLSLSYLENRHSRDHFPTMESLFKKLIDTMVISPQNVTNLTKILTDMGKEASLEHVQEYRRLAGLWDQDTDAGREYASSDRTPQGVQESQQRGSEEHSPAATPEDNPASQGVQESQDQENRPDNTVEPTAEPAAATDDTNAEQAYVAPPLARPPLDSKLVLQPNSPPMPRPSPAPQAVSRRVAEEEPNQHDPRAEGDAKLLFAPGGSQDSHDVTVERDHPDNPPQQTTPLLPHRTPPPTNKLDPLRTSPPRKTAVEATPLIQHTGTTHVQYQPSNQVRRSPSLRTDSLGKECMRQKKCTACTCLVGWPLFLLALAALVAGLGLDSSLRDKIAQNTYDATNFAYKNVTIFLGKIDSDLVTGATVVEKVETGDRSHENSVYVVPESRVKEHHMSLPYAQITTYQDAPILTGGLIRAVYMYRGSITYTINTAFKSVSTGEAWLYIFSSKSSFQEYQDGSPPDAVFQGRLNIGVYPVFEPTRIQFDVSKAGFYYIAVSLPANVYYNYEATIDQVYFDRLDYSPLCTKVYGDDHTCLIDLSKHDPGVYYILGWPMPNPDFGSYTTHLRLSTGGVSESAKQEQDTYKAIWIAGAVVLLLVVVSGFAVLLWPCRPSLRNCRGAGRYEPLEDRV